MEGGRDGRSRRISILTKRCKYGNALALSAASLTALNDRSGVGINNRARDIRLGDSHACGLYAVTVEGGRGRCSKLGCRCSQAMHMSMARRTVAGVLGNRHKRTYVSNVIIK